MGNVHIRNLPEEVHRKLKEKAALEGKSHNDYLVERLTEISSQMSMAEWIEHVKRNPPIIIENPSAAELIREARDERAARWDP